MIPKIEADFEEATGTIITVGHRADGIPYSFHSKHLTLNTVRLVHRGQKECVQFQQTSLVEWSYLVETPVQQNIPVQQKLTSPVQQKDQFSRNHLLPIQQKRRPVQQKLSLPGWVRTLYFLLLYIYYTGCIIQSQIKIQLDTKNENLRISVVVL